MSLTPLDESDREPREGGRPPDDRDDGRAGLLGRVRGAIARAIAALSEGTDSQEPTVETGDGRDERDALEGDSDGRSATALDARTAERSLTWADEPGDDRPESDDGVDRPELVASWDDRGLTLSEQNAAETSISSDTWVDIER